MRFDPPDRVGIEPPARRQPSPCPPPPTLRQPMNKRRQVVRLEPTLPRRCLDPQRPPYPPRFPSKGFLPLPATDVLQRRIREYNIVAAIRKWQRARITHHRALQPRIRVQQIDPRDSNGSIFPRASRPAEIEHRVMQLRTDPLHKPANSSRPPNPKRRVIYFRDHRDLRRDIAGKAQTLPTCFSDHHLKSWALVSWPALTARGR